MTSIETSNVIANGAVNGAVKGDVNGISNGLVNGNSNNKTTQRSKLQPSAEVAISPNDPTKIPSTIESIQSLGSSFSANDDAIRRQLLAEARNLVRALETPRETMIKHNWAQVSIAFQARLVSSQKLTTQALCTHGHHLGCRPRSLQHHVGRQCFPEKGHGACRGSQRGSCSPGSVALAVTSTPKGVLTTHQHARCAT